MIKLPKYWFDHVHLFTPDALKTAQFYETMFNAERVSTKELGDGRIRVELDINGSRVLITERTAQPESAPTPPGAGYGLGHFGLRTDNLEAAVAELKAKGVEFRDEIRVVQPGLKISFLWAPENVLIELQE